MQTVLLKDNISFTGYEDEYVFEKIKLGNFYEIGLLEKWTACMDNNSIVFDVGANLGNHTIYFSKIKDAKHVYAFEPVPKNYDLLVRNCADNNCERVQLFNIGLGSQSGKATIIDNATNFGAIELYEDLEGKIEIFAIDDLDLPDPNFIKIDVEGFEIKVLQGMRNLLKNCQPKIWVEVRKETFCGVHFFMEEYGYWIADFDDKFNILYTKNIADKKITLSDVMEQYYEKVVYAEQEMWRARKKESQFLYEQKKANELLKALQKKESQFLFEQRKANDLSVRYKEEIIKKEEILKEKETDIEKYKHLSEESYLSYQSEKEKNNKLQQEMELYKSSKVYKVQHKLWKLKSDIRFYSKKYVYKYAYKVYRVIEPYPKLVRFAYKINDKLQIIKNKDEARQIYHNSQNISSWKHDPQQKKKIKDLKVAAILDEFSFNCYKYECNLLPIEPDNWIEIFEREKPDFFFCESAWSGLDNKRRPWKGKIYSSINFARENRTVLFSILEYCKEHNIPTIFWNKEDPAHYEDKVHNFVDTAIKFDHIFTTAEECVQRYKEEYGHPSVYSLMFATQPKLFNPIEKYERTDEVIFAGSWYSYHEQRCKEMEEIFDKIIASGKKLVIYNRYYGDSDPNHFFPKKYDAYIKPALPFEEIDKAYKGSEIALNITTVTESETMFARRVFELASCNTAIISNYSVGIEKVFGDNVIFTNGELDFDNLEEKKAENLYNVLTYHTYTQRMEQILDDINYEYMPEDKSVSVYYYVSNEDELDNTIKHFQSISYIDKHLKVIYDDSKLEVNFIRTLENSGIEFYCDSYLKKYGGKTKDTSSYIAYIDITTRLDFIEKAVKHFVYLEDNKCILDDGFKEIVVDQSALDKKCGAYLKKQ